MVKKGVILCGGLATRFLPITKSIAKEMLPILNRPAIDYCIQDLRDNGVTDILIIMGRGKESLENYYDRNIELEDRLLFAHKDKELEELSKIYSDVNISFIRQIYAKGTGYAVLKAKNFVGNEPFILIFPDELIWGESFARQMVENFDDLKASIIPVRKINIADSKKYGMVDFQEDDKGMKVTNIIEKPEPEDSPSDFCYTGGGVFTPEIFTHLENCKVHDNGEIYLTDAFYGLMRSDSLYGTSIVGERIDLGSPMGLIKGNIIAGMSDFKYRDELLQFMKEIVADEEE
ncbi:MAG: UTP--glucose-1-phosphate uridylyltransferase [Clostridiales bacterium]|nr:UTP--glucose-1-phosphate uridylyltransferase [Clostridiales bacterium]